MSIDAMLVWSQIPGKSLMDETSDGLFVSKEIKEVPITRWKVNYLLKVKSINDVKKDLI